MYFRWKTKAIMPAEYPTSSLRSLKTKGGGGGSSNVISGFQLSNLTNAQLDTYVFDGCTFYTSDSSSGHPINATGNTVVTCPAWVKGIIPLLTFTSSGAADTETVVSGYVSSGRGITNSNSNPVVNTFTTSQTNPLSWSFILAGDSGSYQIINANSVTSFSIIGDLVPSDSYYNEITINIEGATSVDLSLYAGLPNPTGYDAWTVVAGSEATSIILPSSIAMYGSTDTYTVGTAASCNAIFAAYNAGGGTSGTLSTLGGGGPTGGVANADYLQCIANGINASFS